MRKYIQFLKIALLAGAAGLTAFLFLWTEGEDNRVVIEAPEVEKDAMSMRTTASTEMLSPRFLGEDSKNRRWEVTAHKAIQQQKGDVESLWLDTLSAYATMENGDEIRFISGSGVFNRAESLLRLEDHVRAEGYGYILETDTLQGNLDARIMAADTTVTITGLAGHIVGGRLNMLENGKVLKISGGVAAKIWPNKTKVGQE